MGLLGRIFEALDYGDRNGGLLALGNFAFNPGTRAAERERVALERDQLTAARDARGVIEGLFSGRAPAQAAMQASGQAGPLAATAKAAEAVDPLAGLNPNQRAILQALSRVDPGAAMQMVASQAFAPPKEPIKVGQDDVLIDPTTMRPVWEGKGKPTGYAADLVAAGIDPMSPRGQALFHDYLRRKGAGVTVNTGDQGPQVGTIPPGFQLVRDGNSYRMEMIPGGPAQIAADAASAAAAGKDRNRAQTAAIVVEDIDFILDRVRNANLPVTGVAGTFLSRLGGDAGDVRQTLNTLQGAISFDTLQRMRESSPTGGALGAVTAPELDMLKAAMGALEQSLTEKTFVRNLQRVRSIFNDIVHGPDYTEAPPAPAEQGGVPDPQAIVEELRRRGRVK